VLSFEVPEPVSPLNSHDALGSKLKEGVGWTRGPDYGTELAPGTFNSPIDLTLKSASPRPPSTLPRRHFIAHIWVELGTKSTYHQHRGAKHTEFVEERCHLEVPGVTSVFDLINVGRMHRHQLGELRR
jgi:hypothetical protein